MKAKHSCSGSPHGTCVNLYDWSYKLKDLALSGATATIRARANATLEEVLRMIRTAEQERSKRLWR